MQLGPDAIPAEQHHAEKAGLEEKGRQHLIGQQRPGDATGELRIGTPVGAELVRHDDARDHAHAEVHREDLQPEVVEVPVDLLLRLQPQRLEYGEVAGQADGDGREDDVEGNGERELHTCQLECFQSEHWATPRLMTSRLVCDGEYGVQHK